MMCPVFRPFPIFVLISAMLMVLMLGGCQSTPRAGTLDSALDAYNAQRYSTAHAHATNAMRSSSGRQREHATYLAGLSAYQLGNFNEAELRLISASSATDRTTAASAKAMIGQMRLDQNRPSDAAVLFEEAARDLTGNDAAEAARYAAIAHRQAGNHVAAAQWSSSTLAQSSASGTFTLQVGAFQERLRAQQAADDTAAAARQAGYGPVQVVPSRDARGRLMYLVQFGRFETRSAAAQARSRMGRLDYIVVAVSSP